ncbi:MAG: cell division protein FtsZ [Saprospiraceae bacterium]|nr:cell division protein FtsZ [Saprospiraceae bacterium]
MQNLNMSQTGIIKVLGVGGSGTNAVTHMYEQGIRGVDFAICNTDIQSLETSTVPHKIQLGPILTVGRGAGNNPEVGMQACVESIEELKRFLEKETKMLFITAGMGGGTGTGAAPLIAKAARELEILTVGIVTLPFQFEGPRRSRLASEGLEQLKSNVDALIVISNNKLREMYGNLSMSGAFAIADSILTTAAKGIAEIITVPGYINVDFEDVNFVMKNSGVAIMGSALASGENRSRKVIEEALNSPLLEDNDIRGARHILLNITTGRNPEITMDEVAEITEYIQQEAGYDTDLIWGSCVDENLDDKISVTLIATGFSTGYKNREDKVKEEIRVSLTDEIKPDIFAETKIQDPARVFDFEEELTSNFNVNSSVPERVSERQLFESNIPKKESKSIDQNIVTPTLFGSLNANPLRPLTEGRNLADTENTPAYERKNVRLDNLPSSSESPTSRNRIFIEEDKGEIRQESSFLHDNVD